MLYKTFSKEYITKGEEVMLNIYKKYPDQDEEVSMLNVCLKNGEKRWVDRREANLLQRNRQIIFVEEIVTEDIDTLYNLYFCTIKDGILYDYSVPGRL